MENPGVIQQILRNLDLCTRCVARYTSKTLIQENFVEQVDTHKKYCRVCLSILQQKEINKTTSKISDLLNEKKYSTNTFSLAISCPQSLVLRQKSLLTHIKNLGYYNGSIHDKSNLTSIKDALKFSILSKVEAETSKKHDTNSPLLVNVDYDYENDVEEIDVLKPLLPKPSNKRKWQSRHNKNNQKSPVNSVRAVADVVENLHDFNVSRYIPVPPEPITSPCNIKVTCCHEPVYLAGRYNKYSRELSQTPWIIEGVRKTQTSVQELISEKLESHLKSEDVRFMSSGREDCDVRMLGRGRPFVVGLIDPKESDLSKGIIQKLQDEINSSTELVAVRDLQLIKKEDLTYLKSGEEEKTKCYSATVWCPEKIPDERIEDLNNDNQEIIIEQSTPIRVLHRRPICVRERRIYYIHLEKIDEHHSKLKLKTQAGTYIKEFVHSDFGRTKPSLCSLLEAPMDILELDVDEVELDWPPKLEV